MGIWKTAVQAKRYANPERTVGPGNISVILLYATNTLTIHPKLLLLVTPNPLRSLFNPQPSTLPKLLRLIACFRKILHSLSMPLFHFKWVEEDVWC